MESVATKYVGIYTAITNRQEAIKIENKALLLEVEQLKADELIVMNFVAKENSAGGLFPAQIEQLESLRAKYVKA